MFTTLQLYRLYLTYALEGLPHIININLSIPQNFIINYLSYLSFLFSLLNFNSSFVNSTSISNSMAEEKHRHHLFHHKKDEEDKPIESVYTETTTGYAETGFSSGSPGGYGDETWDCVVCRKRFVSKNALGGHMKQHPERPWRGLYPPPAGHHAPEASVCVVCAKRFVSKNALGGRMNQHPERSRRVLLPPTGEPAAVRNGNTTTPLLIDLNQPAPSEIDLNQPAPEE